MKSSSSRSPPRATSTPPRWPPSGGTGVFVSALRDALLRGEVDVAVHSLKDLPTAPAAGIALAAVPAREDPATWSSPATASPSASCRRQPRRHRLPAPRRPAGGPRPGPRDRPTSAATSTPGSARSPAASTTPSCSPAPGWPARPARRRTEVLDPLQMLPAPGRARWRSSAAPTTRPGRGRPPRSTTRATRAAVTAERAVLATLEAGCSAPVGALAEVVEGEDGDELWVARVASPDDGTLAVRMSATGPTGPTPPASAIASRARCSPTAPHDLMEAPVKKQQA